MSNIVQFYLFSLKMNSKKELNLLVLFFINFFFVTNPNNILICMNHIANIVKIN